MVNTTAGGRPILEARQLSDTPNPGPVCCFLTHTGMTAEDASQYRRQSSARTKSSRPSAPAAWAKSTALATHGSAAIWVANSNLRIGPIEENCETGLELARYREAGRGWDRTVCGKPMGWRKLGKNGMAPEPDVDTACRPTHGGRLRCHATRSAATGSGKLTCGVWGGVTDTPVVRPTNRAVSPRCRTPTATRSGVDSRYRRSNPSRAAWMHSCGPGARAECGASGGRRGWRSAIPADPAASANSNG